MICILYTQLSSKYLGRRRLDPLYHSINAVSLTRQGDAGRAVLASNNDSIIWMDISACMFPPDPDRSHCPRTGCCLGERQSSQICHNDGLLHGKSATCVCCCNLAARVTYDSSCDDTPRPQKVDDDDLDSGT